MQDLAEQIDAAIPVPPDGSPDLDDVLRAGRGSLRRRRFTVGSAALALAAVVGGTAWALGPGGVAAAPDDGVAGQSSADPWPHDTPAWIDPVTGDLHVQDGWSVVERVDDPVTGPAPAADFPARVIDDSVALALRDDASGGEDEWVLLWWSDDGDGSGDPGISGSGSDHAGEDFDSFARWLAYRSAILLSEPGGDVWGPDAALHTVEQGLVTKPGWKIAERIDDPVGEGSVAVDMTDGDEHQWFLFDGNGGEVSDTRTDPDHPGSPDPTYESFADWVSAMVAATNQPPGEGAR